MWSERERRERGRLAGAGRPGDEDEPARLLGQHLEVRRQPELAQRLDVGRDHAEGGAEHRLLEEDVDAQAADAGDLVRHVDVPLRLEDLLLLGREDPVEQLARLLAGQQLVVLECLEMTAAADDGLRSDGEMEVRRIEILHLLHESVDGERRHRRVGIGTPRG
jgi:hypothetical protein